MHYYISSTIFIFFVHISYGMKCIRNGTEVCCSGYKMNNTSGQCDKCPPGYTGMGCAYRCHYPSHGVDCFMKCECSADLCDFLSGCKHISTVADHGTSYMNNSASNKAESSTHTTSIKTRPSPISTSSISLVFYITVVLISVFVISFLIYGINYLRNICISKQKLISSVTQTKNADNSLYECVDFPHHM